MLGGQGPCKDHPNVQTGKAPQAGWTEWRVMVFTQTEGQIQPPEQTAFQGLAQGTAICRQGRGMLTGGAPTEAVRTTGSLDMGQWKY